MELKELKDVICDPTTGETQIVLKDGLVRTMRVEFRELRVLEEVAGLPWWRAGELPMSARSLAIFIYAGCYADAHRRKESWSLAVVDDLISLDSFGDLWTRSSCSVAAALARIGASGDRKAGEIKASVQTTPKRSHGRGTRR